MENDENTTKPDYYTGGARLSRVGQGLAGLGSGGTSWVSFFVVCFVDLGLLQLYHDNTWLVLSCVRGCVWVVVGYVRTH